MIKRIAITILLLTTFLTPVSYGSEATKTILITSSTGALGSAIAKDLASKGYNLILAARDVDKLQALQKEIGNKVKIDSIKLDYNNVEQSILAIADLQDKSIDGIVVIGPRPNFTVDIPQASQWRANFEATFIGPLEFMRHVVNKMKDHGAVVVISGETSKQYMPDYPNSNVIRLMWSGEIKNLCYQLREHHIRVNAISPGVILTEHNVNKIKKRATAANKSFEEQLAAETMLLPSQRYGTLQDVTAVVEFLLKGDSRYINCENIVMSGGSNKGY